MRPMPEFPIRQNCVSLLALPRDDRLQPGLAAEESMIKSHVGLQRAYLAAAPATRRRHILSIADLDQADISHIVNRSVQLAGQRDYEKTLAGKAVGIYFRKTSTRTRTSFTVGAAKLGAVTVAYGPGDLQTNTGE